jgi:hypothetical protein
MFKRRYELSWRRQRGEPPPEPPPVPPPDPEASRTSGVLAFIGATTHTDDDINAGTGIV